jgi:hypothetical protein
MSCCLLGKERPPETSMCMDCSTGMPRISEGAEGKELASRWNLVANYCCHPGLSGRDPLLQFQAPVYRGFEVTKYIWEYLLAQVPHHKQHPRQ